MNEPPRTKEDIVNAIARLLGVEPPRMSSGSTEPREIFDVVIDSFGLIATPEATRTKPREAQTIVEAAGMQWLPNYESTGSTVTKDGLLAVLSAVQYFKGA